MPEKRRSKLEQDFEKILNFFNVKYNYENINIEYDIPLSKHKYKVDWSFVNLPFYIETKGWFLQHKKEINIYLLKNNILI